MKAVLPVLVALLLALSTGLTTATPSSFHYSEWSCFLPNFNPMTRYMQGNIEYPHQWPTLSSSPDQPLGIYFIDDSYFFDYLSLPGGKLVRVAPVTPLYAYLTGPGAYGQMIDNVFYLESGYDTALLFGTQDQYGTSVALELVNLSSDGVLFWNTGWPTTPLNQQANYVGNDTVVVTSENGSMEAFDLADQTQWSAGRLAFFEANNLYWIPQLREWVNVEAHNSTGDFVQQLSSSTDSEGRLTFTPVSDFAFDAGIPMNWVNGIGYNATYGAYGAIAFSGGNARLGMVFTWVVPFGPNGTLTPRGITRADGYGTPDLITGQRYTYTSSYLLGGVVGGVQYLYDPWSQTALATNIAGSAGVPNGNGVFEGTTSTSPNHLIDFSTTLAVNQPTYKVIYADHNGSSPFCAGPLTPLWSDPGIWLGLSIGLVGGVAAWILRRRADLGGSDR